MQKKKLLTIISVALISALTIGGTIAYLCAKYGMNVLDCGVPVLSMHAPWEIVSKADVYEAYKCYCAFLKEAGKRSL